MRPPAKRAPYKRTLTSILVQRIKPRAAAFLVWDEKTRGLALRVERSGYRSYKYIYARAGKTRWYNIGPADIISLSAARTKATELGAAVILEGKDPQAQRVSQRTDGTFSALADAYLVHAKKKNRSWPQARKLVERHLLPKWGKLPAADIKRAHVRALMASIDAPVAANQALASASAIFTWAIREELLKDNPCRLVERNPTRSRERVLSGTELPLFWSALGDAEPITAAALRVLLLVGQRPGEVAFMRAEHIKDGWWELPGMPDPASGWPGTKNSQTHKVWLPARAQEIVRFLTAEGEVGFVFAGPRGRPSANLDGVMRDVCRLTGIPRATPHDLRRTHGTMITGMGFGREMMNRIENHREGGIADVYDRSSYAEAMRNCMEVVAARLLLLCGEGEPEASNVIALAR